MTTHAVILNHRCFTRLITLTPFTSPIIFPPRTGRFFRPDPKSHKYLSIDRPCRLNDNGMSLIDLVRSRFRSAKPLIGIRRESTSGGIERAAARAVELALMAARYLGKTRERRSI